MSLSFDEMSPSDFENCFDWRPEFLQPANLQTESDYPKAIIDSPSRFLASGLSVCNEILSQDFNGESFAEEEGEIEEEVEEETDERDSTTLSKVPSSPDSLLIKLEKRSQTSCSVLGSCSSSAVGRFSGEREESQRMLFKSMESCYSFLDQKLETFRDRELSYIASYRGFEHYKELLPVKKIKSDGEKFKVFFREDEEEKESEELSRKDSGKARKFWRKQESLAKLVSQTQLDLVEHICKAADLKKVSNAKEIHASVFEGIYKEKTKQKVGIDCDNLPVACVEKKQRKETLLSLEEIELKSCSTVNLKQKRSDGKISKKAVKKIHKELEAIKSFSKLIVNRALVQE